MFVSTPTVSRGYVRVSRHLKYFDPCIYPNRSKRCPQAFFAYLLFPPCMRHQILPSLSQPTRQYCPSWYRGKWKRPTRHLPSSKIGRASRRERAENQGGGRVSTGHEDD